MNRGRYCPVYNPMGTYKDTASKNWYETTFPITSTYSAFQNIGTAIGRPDGKSDKYIYSENFIDKRTNAEKANIPQLLNEVHNGAVNGSLSGNSDTVGTEQVTQTTTGTVATLEVGTKLKYSVGDVLQIWNGTTPYRRFILSVSGTTVTLDSTIVKTAVAFVISGGKLPITSYKTSLSIDVVGSPANYPTVWLGVLASCKPLVGLNPLLISDSGDNLIPDGVDKGFKYSAKLSKPLGMNFLISGVWYSQTPAQQKVYFDSISNVHNGESTEQIDRLSIHNYTSSNPVANISTPKAVQQVGNYAVATNSHSIYKGNNLTQLTGKVAVGNGGKGLVSKVVEDVSVVSEANIYLASSGTSPYGLATGTVFFDDTTLYNTQKYYSYNGTTVSSTFNFSSFNFNTTGWVETSICGFPSHSTIALDNSNSPAIKTLSTIATADDGELLYQVFGEEGKLNTTWGFDTDFSQLTNGTLVDLNGATVRTIVATAGLGVYK